MGRWINRDPINELGFQFAKGNAKNYDINNRFEKYYELVTGRLLKGSDAFLDGGNNHYVFVKNNPMKFIDPEGLAVWLCNRPLSFVKKDPGKDSIRTHAFIWVDSVNTGYGVSTKHPILAALGDTVDGYIVKESSKGKDCTKIYTCPTREKQILKYIQSEDNNRFLRYNLYTLNCNHWATKVLQSVD